MGGFAENLKVLRSQKGWRQEDLANALGISKQDYLLGVSDYQDHNKEAFSGCIEEQILKSILALQVHLDKQREA